MNTLNFKVEDNKEEAINILRNKGYRKIGHIKDECVGLCILINRKEFFEISNIRNRSIQETSNISDIVLYCSK